METREIIRCPNCYSSDVVDMNEFWYCYRCSDSFAYPLNPLDYNISAYNQMCEEVDRQMDWIDLCMEDLEDWSADEIERLYNFFKDYYENKRD